MNDPQFVMLDDMPPTGHDPKVGEQQDRLFLKMPCLEDTGKPVLDYLTDRALRSQAKYGPITRAYACVRPDSVVVEAFYKAP